MSGRCPICDGYCESVQTDGKYPAPVCPGHKELVREAKRLYPRCTAPDCGGIECDCGDRPRGTAA